MLKMRLLLVGGALCIALIVGLAYSLRPTRSSDASTKVVDSTRPESRQPPALTLRLQWPEAEVVAAEEPGQSAGETEVTEQPPSAVVASLTGDFESAAVQRVAIWKALEESGPPGAFASEAARQVAGWRGLLADQQSPVSVVAERCYAGGCAVEMRYPDPRTADLSGTLLLGAASGWQGPIAMTRLEPNPDGQLENLVVLLAP